MKRIITILLALVMAVLLTGCAKKTDDLSGHGKRFEVIYDGTHFNIIVDMETGVEYAVSDDTHNRGTLTMLYDSYGNPYIYPAFDAREDRLP